jgi:3-oxoacyl-[acyl-carrier protein] reductase
MAPTSTPTALVTGSSRGIGLGIALRLAQAGFNILLNCRHDSLELAAAERLIQETGAKTARIPFDISNIDGHNLALDAAWDRFGGLHCLVNNAGISVRQRGDILDVQPESFDEQIAVNLRGTFFLTQNVARRMIGAASDAFRSIITISSSNAVAASVERAEYCLAKSSLSMMTKLFAVRLAPSQINVYEVRPGLISTAMTSTVRDRYDALLSKGFSPINRWGEPDDVGRAVAMLARGDMAFSTGEPIHIDGGLLVSRY